MYPARIQWDAGSVPIHGNTFLFQIFIVQVHIHMEIQREIEVQKQIELEIYRNKFGLIMGHRTMLSSALAEYTGGYHGLLEYFYAIY